MQPNEYQKLARRTATQHALTNLNFGLTNWGLGLAGEAGEVLEVTNAFSRDAALDDHDLLVKEVGDCMWYIALFCEQIGTTLEDLPEVKMKSDVPAFSAITLTVAACKVADYVKKVVSHGHELNRETLTTMVAACYHHITKFCAARGIDMSEVFIKNIAKLKERYPDGFSTERSLNRGSA